MDGKSDFELDLRRRMAIVDQVLNSIRVVLEEESRCKVSKRTQGRQAPLSGVLPSVPGWYELFQVGGNRRALTIACLLQGLQQLCGFVCSFGGALNI